MRLFIHYQTGLFVAAACFPFLHSQRHARAVEVPAALKAAEESRSQFLTAQFEWKQILIDRNDTRRFSSQYAGEDQIYVYRGNSTGQRLPGPDRSGEPYAFSEDRKLMSGGRQWYYIEESLEAEIRDDNNLHPFLDISLLGFVDAPSATEVPGGYLPQGITRFETESSNGVIEVSAYYDEGEGIRRIWRLDPAVGMQPVRCSSWVNGQEITRCDTEYEEADGRWFPARSTFFFMGDATVRIVVMCASFDKPWHDRELTPADLGLVAGVHVVEAGQPVRLWDGKKTITIDEYARGVSQGEIDNSAMIELRRRHKEGVSPKRYASTVDEAGFFGLGAAVKRQPELWETYVRRFIAFYRLNVEQATKAWKHHGECVSAVHQHREQHEKELREITERIALLETRKPRSDEDEEALRASQRRIEELSAFIDKVFDERLKPGLLKLPNDTQKKEALNHRSSAKPGDG